MRDGADERLNGLNSRENDRQGRVENREGLGDGDQLSSRIGIDPVQ